VKHTVPTKMHDAGALIVVVCATLLSSQPALAKFTQQGPKLVGTGAVGAALQGAPVALSADGNTAIVGGFGDNRYAGAAWIWTRSGGVWSQQSNKLVGSGAVGAAGQGYSVSLSADGNTAMVGGSEDNSYVGAAWVWTRSGGVWTQQGNKLVGLGAVGAAFQGRSVSLSADGNTAIVGGFGDNNFAGAAWVWTRSGGVWTQQSTKLVGSGASADAGQGSSVSLSADGNTALVGGPHDNREVGAAWVWTRSGGVWTQKGDKLVGSGTVGAADQGESVSLSADGNTAIVGGWNDNNHAGAAWVWTKNGVVWTQQGSKLVGLGAVGNAEQGISVSLSSDGNTAIVGGIEDNGLAGGLANNGFAGWRVSDDPADHAVSNATRYAASDAIGDSASYGATWVWTRSGGVWTQQSNKLVGSGAVGAAQQGYSALSADGNTAIVGGFNDNSGLGAAWVFVAGVENVVPQRRRAVRH
jgi:hypothetical protein